MFCIEWLVHMYHTSTIISDNWLIVCVRIVLHAEEVAEEFCDFILKVEDRKSVV